MGSKIALHHVGGRWGNHPFPHLSAFAADFVDVLYEADADAIPGIYEARKDHPSELIVIPACLSDADGEAFLHVYINPGFTSLRELGLTLQRRYLHLYGIDFDFSEDGSRLLEKRKVATSRLDSLIDAPDRCCPPPDILSLDVQSGEYEVLLGARGNLERSVCGLIVEVEFGEMYLGQRRFQDICDLLDGAGFDFVRFLSIGEASGPAAPLGFRGGGYQSWADALFLRRPDRIPTDSERRCETLTKLCFIALVFGMIELAVECLAALGDMQPSQPTGLPLRAYESFVAAAREAYERDAKLWPPVFSAILPPHRIADFATAATPAQWPRIFEGLRSFDALYLRALEQMEMTDDSEFEALLRCHGLTEQADRVNFTRRHQAHSIRRAIDAAHSL